MLAPAVRASIARRRPGAPRQGRTVARVPRRARAARPIGLIPPGALAGPARAPRAPAPPRSAPWASRRSRAISGASKSAWASFASFTPSWSRSTRVRTSAASPSARSPSSNGPKETRIRRLTASPRCSSTFLISRFFPSLRPKRDPDVRALFAVELGLDAEIVDAVDGDPAAQSVERRLIDRPMRAHAIAAQPAGRRAAPAPAPARRRW